MSTPDWPLYVFRALSAMHLDGPPEPEAEAYLDAFIATWGGLDVEALHRALGAGDESHRLFALCALGASGAERARAALLPFLTSDRLPERWASALALGNVREERALPVLYRMLAEALPPDETFRRCWDWRFAVPDILGAWGRAESAPPLRAALQAAIRIEGRDDEPGWYYGAENWAGYENALVYALGQLGAFGALTGVEGIDGPVERLGNAFLVGTAGRLDLWRVHLLLGHLHGHYPIGGLMTPIWRDNPQVRAAVAPLLERVFGLDGEERARCLDRYDADAIAFFLRQKLWNARQWEARVRAEGGIP